MISVHHYGEKKYIGDILLTIYLSVNIAKNVCSAAGIGNVPTACRPALASAPNIGKVLSICLRQISPYKL